MIDADESPTTSNWIAGTTKLVRGRDILYLGVLPAMALVAWFVPERWWDPICHRLVRLAGWVGIGRHMRGMKTIARLVDGRADVVDARVFVPVLSANSHRARLHILRCHRPPAWQPEIALAGAEHLEGALGAGRGAILWVAPFIFSDLLTKMALHRRGFRVSHLSRNGHGFSPTRLGVRWLNPLWTAVENRYLAERLVMSPDNWARALRTLVQRVRQNRIVSVTVGSQGQRTVSVPLLNGTLQLADAVPALALRTGAALLPVFTVRRPDGSFTMTIEPALRVHGDLAAGDAVRQLMTQEASLLESWVLRFPEQFVVWETVRLSPPANGSGVAAHR